MYAEFMRVRFKKNGGVVEKSHLEERLGFGEKWGSVGDGGGSYQT